MEGLAESVREQPAIPRFEDGSVNLRELMRRIGEDVANAIMDAEAAFARVESNHIAEYVLSISMSDMPTTAIR